MRWATEVTFQHHQIIIAIFRLPRNFEFKNAPHAQLCLLTPRLTSFHAHRLPPSSLSNGSGRTPGHSELQGLASHHELLGPWRENKKSKITWTNFFWAKILRTPVITHLLDGEPPPFVAHTFCVCFGHRERRLSSST